ncbi:OmpH family outer membrane protein [Candidatus Omnitrophota bacterium]
MRRILVGIIALALSLSFATAGFAKEVKIGYVDMRKIFFEYKKTKEFNAELEKEDEKIKKEIEEKTQVIRKLRDEIDLLSERAKEQRQPELREKIRALEEFRRGKVDELLKKKEEMFQEIRENVMKVSSEFSKKNGYDIIFDEAMFVYSSDQYDVTDPILKQLNR